MHDGRQTTLLDPAAQLRALCTSRTQVQRPMGVGSFSRRIGRKVDTWQPSETGLEYYPSEGRAIIRKTELYGVLSCFTTIWQMLYKHIRYLTYDCTLETHRFAQNLSQGPLFEIQAILWKLTPPSFSKREAFGELILSIEKARQRLREMEQRGA